MSSNCLWNGKQWLHFNNQICLTIGQIWAFISFYSRSSCLCWCRLRMATFPFSDINTDRKEAKEGNYPFIAAIGFRSFCHLWLRRNTDQPTIRHHRGSLPLETEADLGGRDRAVRVRVPVQVQILPEEASLQGTNPAKLCRPNWCCCNLRYLGVNAPHFVNICKQEQMS